MIRGWERTYMTTGENDLKKEKNMLLRKINAGISLLCTLLLLDHAIFHAAWMLSGGSIEKSADSLPWILFLLMMVHAVISIVLAFLGHKGAEKRKCKNYPQLNASTVIQRVSGMVMILLAVQHVLGVNGLWRVPPVVHVVLPPLFFAVALSHMAVSVSKALITLGIGNARFVKTADVIMKVLCGITLIADIVSYYIFLG